MDRGGDKNLSLSADEDDFEPELSDRDHQRREYGQNRDGPSTNQARNTDSYSQDYYDYDYDEWTSADHQADQREHYAMERRGDYDKYYDDDDDYEPRKSNVGNPPPYSDDFPARKEQAYSHNESSAYPKNAYDAHNSTCAPPTSPPTVQSYPRTNNVEQNQPQHTSYVQSYRDNTSVVKSQNRTDAPAPGIGAQPMYAGQYALVLRMPEEPLQDVPSYKCSSILVMLFCCLPFGIAGLVYSFNAENLKFQRKYSEAKKVAYKAKTMNIMGVVFGILIWIINGVLFYLQLQGIRARHQGHH